MRHEDVAERFFTFTDEELAWWDEDEAEAQPAPPHPAAAPGPSEREKARQAARRRRRVAYVVFLATAVALALGVRALTSGEGAPEPATASPTTAPTQTTASETPARAAPAEPAAPTLLEEGDRGAWVRDLQVALAVLGLYGSEPDGGFSAGTTAAVAAFQGAQGLSADGVVGPATREALVDSIRASAREDVNAARAGLAEAVASGRLDPGAEAQASATATEALGALDGLSPGRAAVLALVLDDVASASGPYDEARAQALFGMLEANVLHLEAGRLTIEGRDVADGTGGVYRFDPEHGYQFHPLGSFTRLNRLVREGSREEVERLAYALRARALRRGNTLVWEYDSAAGGPERWISGPAQAAGAEALARSGELLGDPSLVEAGARAYRALPRRLSMSLGGGTWVREYGYSDQAILNAQLQSIASLSHYTEVSGDEDARVYVAELTEAARTLIGEFDTGCWSRYLLGGEPASPSYHAYHVRLLRRLGQETGDAFWQETAARWAQYQRSGGC